MPFLLSNVFPSYTPVFAKDMPFTLPNSPHVTSDKNPVGRNRLSQNVSRMADCDHIQSTSYETRAASRRGKHRSGTEILVEESDWLSYCHVARYYFT